ncbi:MAG: hypothetical protein HeimC3_15320 [Candidatus Heimdallarchaeota archaeon LC_3]|nr:MAG: hypothetical protein HeimC3_15320 [Candidatus Heimdallarchaeota archaeon LC_3]
MKNGLKKEYRALIKIKNQLKVMIIPKFSIDFNLLRKTKFSQNNLFLR